MGIDNTTRRMQDPDDDLSAELDHIRAGIEIASDLPMTADPRQVVTIYAPRLLAAVDGVLELADELDVPPYFLDDVTAAVRSCALRFREAITRALTGEENADGSR